MPAFRGQAGVDFEGLYFDGYLITKLVSQKNQEET